MANGVVADAAGNLTLEELTASDITDLLAEVDERGIYKRVCKDFAKSGNVYIIINANPSLAKKKQPAIVQSLKLNLKELEKDADFPKCKIVKKGDNTLLVNTAAHAAQVLAEAEAATASE